MTDFRLILKLILDEATKKKAIKGIKEVQSEIDSLGVNTPAGGKKSRKSQSVQVDTTETETVVKNSRKRKKAYEEEAAALEKATKRSAVVNSRSKDEVPWNAVSLVGKSRKERDAEVLRVMKGIKTPEEILAEMSPDERIQKQLDHLHSLSPEQQDIERWKSLAEWNGVTVEKMKELVEQDKILKAETAERVRIQREAELQARRERRLAMQEEAQRPALEAQKKAEELEMLKSKNLEYYEEISRASDQRMEAERSADRERRQKQDELLEREKRRQEIESQILRKYQEQTKEANRLANTSERLARMGQGLLIAGTAIVGGAFAMANREAQRQQGTGKVDETTKAWLKAQERIERSTQRIGRAWEKTVLPYLEAASRVAEKASKYFEANPEVAKAIFAAGAIAATIGGALVLLSRGIRVVADFKYLAANAEFDLATRRFEASVNKMAMSQAVPGGAAGKGILAGGVGAGAASIAATVATVLAVIVAGATIGTIIYDLIAKYTGKARFGTIAAGGANLAGQGMEKIAVANGMDEEEAKRKTLVFTYLIGRVFGAIKEGDPAWQGVVDGANKAAGALEDFGNTAENEAAGFEVLKNLAQEQAEAERKFADDRRDILIESGRSLDDANRELASTMAEIAQNLTRAIGSIQSELKSTLADLEASFNDANLQAEKEYQQARSEIVSNGQREIEQIQEQGKRDLEQLEREHQRNLKGIIDERDAYALDEENKAYEERKNEIEEGIALAVEQARENTRLQLEEAARNYEEQRKQREDEYLKQKAEAEERAKQAIIEARAKAEEDKKQAQANYEERKKEIDRQTREALDDLRRRFEDERRERVIAASQALQELGTNLQAEVALRRQYYDIIMADLNQHMKNLASVQSSAGPAQSSSSKSGYTSTRSGPGFTADRPTTKLLERAVGGELTQANIANAAKGGSGVSIVWEDHRVFGGDVPLHVRNAIKEDTLASVALAIQKAQRKR
jgi:hypothetical protein